MRIARVLAAAAVGAASLSTFATPASAHNDCEEHPHHCYECVMYPCYPEDWPPFLIDKVTELLPR